MSAEIVEVIHDCTEWCGIYIRSVVLAKTGDKGEQHAHDFDHLTYCGAGAAEFYQNGELVGIVKAGDAARVMANQQHYFVALEDNTRLACIHDVSSAEAARGRT